MDFQYKILTNVLHLNKMLFWFGNPSPFYFFGKLHDETLIHLTLLFPHTTTFPLVKGNRCFLVQNMILMVLKLHDYKSRISSTFSFNTFVYYLFKIKNLEKGAAFNNKQEHDMFLKNWSIVEHVLPQKKYFVIWTFNL